MLLKASFRDFRYDFSVLILGLAFMTSISCRVLGSTVDNDSAINLVLLAVYAFAHSHNQDIKTVDCPHDGRTQILMLGSSEALSSQSLVLLTNNPLILNSGKIRVAAVEPLENGFSSSLVQVENDRKNIKGQKSGDIDWVINDMFKLSHITPEDTVVILYPVSQDDPLNNEKEVLSQIAHFLLAGLSGNQESRRFIFSDGSAVNINQGTGKRYAFQRKDGTDAGTIPQYCPCQTTTHLETCTCSASEPKGAEKGTGNCAACAYMSLLCKEVPALKVLSNSYEIKVFDAPQKRKDDKDDDKGDGFGSPFAKNLRKSKMFGGD